MVQTTPAEAGASSKAQALLTWSRELQDLSCLLCTDSQEARRESEALRDESFVIRLRSTYLQKWRKESIGACRRTINQRGNFYHVETVRHA